MVGLKATLLIRNEKQYLINLDPMIMCFLREAECLGRMGLDLPPEAIGFQFMRGKLRKNFDALNVSINCHKIQIKQFLIGNGTRV